MRLTVELDGKPTVVVLADDLSTVDVGGRVYPVRVVRRNPGRVDLEVGGEAVSVQGWPDREPTPPGPVDVNGERHAVRVTVEAPATALPGGVAPVASTAGTQVPLAPPSVTAALGATVVVPPMPGRVVEVRVKDGDRVEAGAVLLVVEAMKMRNEVVAPVAGVVRDVRVRDGTNVRAREPMLTVVPD